MKAKKNGIKETDLNEYGIIYLSGTINEETSEKVCQEIIEFNISGKVDHIQMIINSSGGECPSGFAIIDLMEWSQIPVFTTGVGMIASMGLLVFMTGQKSRRVITPRTSILSHRFLSAALGNHSQLLAIRKQQDIVHARIVDHYLQYSNLTSENEIEKYLLKDVDTWLTPDEAVNYGIADIVESIRNSIGNERS